MASLAIADLIRRLPKVELHVHMEGTLMPSLRFKLAQKHGISMPWSSAEAMHSHYKNWWESVVGGSVALEEAAGEFFSLYFGAIDVLRDEESYYEMAMEFFTHAAGANVRYMEIFFNPQASTTRGISLGTVLSAYRRAKQDAEKNLNVRCQFIMAFLRTESIESATEMYEAASKNRDLICGIGLDGASDGGSLLAFDGIFRRAKADGFRTTAHVDSELPNQHAHLLEALMELGGNGLDRIDHGACVAEFPDLVELVKTKGTGVTCCPWPFCGVFTGEKRKMFFEEMTRKCFDQGVLISIGSDDPPYFGFNWVLENLLLVQEKLGHSAEDMVSWQENAIASSWAPEDIKVAFREELEKARTVFGKGEQEK